MSDALKISAGLHAADWLTRSVQRENEPVKLKMTVALSMPKTIAGTKIKPMESSPWNVVTGAGTP